MSSIEVDRSSYSIFWRLVAAPSALRRRPEADIQGESTSSPFYFFNNSLNSPISIVLASYTLNKFTSSI